MWPLSHALWPLIRCGYFGHCSVYVV